MSKLRNKNSEEGLFIQCGSLLQLCISLFFIYGASLSNFVFKCIFIVIALVFLMTSMMMIVKFSLHFNFNHDYLIKWIFIFLISYIALACVGWFFPLILFVVTFILFIYGIHKLAKIIVNSKNDNFHNILINSHFKEVRKIHNNKNNKDGNHND